MIINSANLQGLFRGFSTSFNKGFEGVPSSYQDIAMETKSDTREMTYGWLGQMPGLREWLGDRHIKSVAAHGFTIRNRDFEATVSVSANDIEDDQYGVYAPLFTDLGRSAAEHPNRLIFELLAKGFDEPCYDGQNFFDTEHPTGEDEAPTPNMQAGEGPAWFLLDTSRAVRPLILQMRRQSRLQGITSPEAEGVFMRREYLYGADSRCNAGFGLWQLAFGSKAELTPENYAAARALMGTLKGDEGRPLGVRPTLLVVPPALEEAGLDLLKPNLEGGASNIWADSVKLMVSPWLA